LEGGVDKDYFVLKLTPVSKKGWLMNKPAYKFKNARLNKLQKILKQTFTSWEEAHADPRCKDVAEWVMRSLWDPRATSSVGLADPDCPGGEILEALCKRFDL
jgi:hypothetical protein